MSIKYRNIATVAGERKLAAADQVSHTLRVVTKSSPKVAGKVALTNVRAEFIEAFPMTVTNGTDTGVDGVAIRTTISGTTLNKAAIAAAVTQHQANVQAAIADGILEGFIPECDFIAKA